MELYDYIADAVNQSLALGYIGRIETYCRGLDTFPERGIKRDDIRPGLRITNFERRAAIAYHCEQNTVVIDRILYGGRLPHRRIQLSANRPPHHLLGITPMKITACNREIVY